MAAPEERVRQSGRHHRLRPDGERARALGGHPVRVPTEAPRSDFVLPNAVLLEPDGTLRTGLDVAAVARAIAEERPLWVDVDSTQPEQVAVLASVFHFHPLSVEDALNARGRVKIEEFKDYLFVLLRGVRFCDETEDPYDTETYALGLFVGKSFLVSVRGEHSPGVKEMRSRLERNPEFLGRGVARLMHAIADIEIDAFFPVVDQIDDFIDGLEERVFASFEEGALRDIFTVKRLVLRLRRHVAPEREVFAALANRPSPFLPPEVQVYFRDVYDHVLRVNDALETFRELLSSTLDSYLTQVSNRLAIATKGLAVIGTIGLPFMILSGIWGMNFEHIPLGHLHHGFALMMGIQFLIGIVLLAGLRLRRIL